MIVIPAGVQVHLALGYTDMVRDSTDLRLSSRNI